jgi:hypothetical protein
MLTQAPETASVGTRSAATESPDDLSDHRHRQVIGYLGLALPTLLVVAERLRPNAAADQWSASSISAYYWTGAVSIFVGILAALSVYLLTYQGYANEYQKWDRLAAIVAGVSAAVVALFPTSPPHGIATLPWWSGWISKVHAIAAIALFSMFALFSLWLFRKSTPGEPPPPDKKQRNTIYLGCGIVIVASMIWALVAGQTDQSIFWPESVALVSFALSWLVKGRAVSSIKSTFGSATDKITN